MPLKYGEVLMISQIYIDSPKVQTNSKFINRFCIKTDFAYCSMLKRGMRSKILVLHIDKNTNQHSFLSENPPD